MSNERPSPPTAAEVELRKLLHEQNIKAAQHAHDKSDEFARQTNEAAINGANLALRMALLINGGCCRCAPHIHWRPTARRQKRAVAATLDWFAWGLPPH